jgi:hypothetical protein
MKSRSFADKAFLAFDGRASKRGLQALRDVPYLMIVSDDGMLTAKPESAMPLHIDGIPYFAFSGYVDCLDSTNKPVAR